MAACFINVTGCSTKVRNNSTEVRIYSTKLRQNSTDIGQIHVNLSYIRRVLSYFRRVLSYIRRVLPYIRRVIFYIRRVKIDISRVYLLSWIGNSSNGTIWKWLSNDMIIIAKRNSLWMEILILSKGFAFISCKTAHIITIKPFCLIFQTFLISLQTNRVIVVSLFHFYKSLLQTPYFMLFSRFPRVILESY